MEKSHGQVRTVGWNSANHASNIIYSLSSGVVIYTRNNWGSVVHNVAGSYDTLSNSLQLSLYGTRLCVFDLVSF